MVEITKDQIEQMDAQTLEDIKKDLEERMLIYTDSRQPSADEVTIAWLVMRVDELEERRTLGIAD